MRYKLSEGPVERAQRLLVYGPEGIGKSTMASLMPDPVFVDVEDGTNHLYVRRFPTPSSWTLLMDECRAVAEDPVGIGTLVIDSVDAAERLCQSGVCSKAKKESIESWGYGKGYVIAAEEFQNLLRVLDRCIDAGVNVCLIAHSQMRKFERPDEAGAYDRFEVKLNKHIASKVKEWADAVLFLDYETFVSVDEQGKGKASGGKRVIRTSHNVSWDAKNRWELPEKIPLDHDGIMLVTANMPTKVQDRERKAQKPEKASEPKPTKPTNAKGVPKALQPLIALTERDGISPAEVKAVMVAKGKRDESQGILDWEPPFVDWVVANWSRVTELVMESRAESEKDGEEDIPF